MEHLPALAAAVEWPDADASAAARARPKRASAGVLDEIVIWLAGTQGASPPLLPRRVRLLRYGTEAEPIDSLAADLDVTTRTVVGTSFEDGVALADSEVDTGADLLLISGRADPNACALAVSAVTNAEPVALLPRGAGAIDTKAWIARAEYVRDRRPALLEVRDRPDELLEAIADGALASTCGLIARAITRRTPVILDGELAVASALVAHAAQPRFAAWWRVADASTSPVQARALDAFRQKALLALGIETSDGTAALLAVLAARTAIALAATNPAGG